MTLSGRVVFVVVALAGCTAPNPRSCKDGLCSDERYPFCDVDGTFQEFPETCIAVECSAGEFAGCRGDVSLRCNATGNDYDLIACELGCDSTRGCISCSSSAQCANPTPVCDTLAGACRGCVAGSDCPSKVCDVDGGACLAESEVVYATPTGGDATPCSMASPCSLTQAAVIASGNSLRSTIWLAPGNYARAVEVSMGSIKLIGEGATIVGPPSPSSVLAVLNVGAGATVRADGVTFDLLRYGLNCGGVGTSGPFVHGGTVVLRDVDILDPVGRSAVFSNGCSATLREVDVTGGPSSGVVFSNTVGNTVPGSVSIDRVRFVSTLPDNSSFVVGELISGTITNSLFIDVTTVRLDAGRMAFSTVVGGRVYDTIGAALFENNIIAPATGDAISCTSCTVRNNVLFPQAAPKPNNIVADPQFENAANKNFRLTSTSPAVNAAMPSPGLDPAHDHEGVMRPQGPAKDIGAFERTP